MAAGGGVAEDVGAEFLVHQDPGARHRHLVERRLEALVDQSLAVSHRFLLRRGERRREVEHAGLVGVPVIERQ